ncbi:unnamed protein product [Meloidogyne enterolobii]|uniref:Uncharacterized protein n=1 Tax=Meloidogyne enterolobii TaxID=390850 RepID=A0ACB0YBM5_MELEN
MKMKISIFYLSILLVIFADQTLGDIPIVHWEWRDLVCKTGDKELPGDKISEKPAECTIGLREKERDTNRRLAPKGAGCFDEIVNGTTRTYCDVLCPNADTVYLIKRDPQVHRFCFVFYTHKLERRGNNWFLWRQDKCRHSQITFTIRCEFLFSRNETPSDIELFNSLVRRN